VLTRKKWWRAPVVENRTLHAPPNRQCQVTSHSRVRSTSGIALCQTLTRLALLVVPVAGIPAAPLMDKAGSGVMG
jgi:hypothetical protein